MWQSDFHTEKLLKCYIFKTGWESDRAVPATQNTLPNAIRNRPYVWCLKHAKKRKFYSFWCIASLLRFQSWINFFRDLSSNSRYQITLLEGNTSVFRGIFEASAWATTATSASPFAFSSSSGASAIASPSAVKPGKSFQKSCSVLISRQTNWICDNSSCFNTIR